VKRSRAQRKRARHTRRHRYGWQLVYWLEQTVANPGSAPKLVVDLYKSMAERFLKRANLPRGISRRLQRALRRFDEDREAHECAARLLAAGQEENPFSMGAQQQYAIPPGASFSVDDGSGVQHFGCGLHHGKSTAVEVAAMLCARGFDASPVGENGISISVNVQVQKPAPFIRLPLAGPPIIDEAHDFVLEDAIPAGLQPMLDDQPGELVVVSTPTREPGSPGPWEKK
jgi:hypothetical protein